MQDAINKFGPLAGRILLSLIFLLSGINKIGGFAGTAGWMTSKGMPMAEVLLAITIVIEIGASLMIIGGYKARLGAAALFLWMIPVTFAFHNFWAAADAAKQIEMIMFMKNLGLMGGMLYIMAFGSGPMSIDKK
ncbi:MAG TPA: DoxX family protein [Acidiferrobacterales bacterium]|nr:DoxX family protein [Acidiferrobacterales bacterium]